MPTGERLRGSREAHGPKRRNRRRTNTRRSTRANQALRAREAGRRSVSSRYVVPAARWVMPSDISFEIPSVASPRDYQDRPGDAQPTWSSAAVRSPYKRTHSRSSPALDSINIHPQDRRASQERDAALVLREDYRRQECRSQTGLAARVVRLVAWRYLDPPPRSWSSPGPPPPSCWRSSRRSCRCSRRSCRRS